METRSALSAAALLVATVRILRILLLLLSGLLPAALLIRARIALLLLAGLVRWIVLMLRILVRIGHCGSPLWRHPPGQFAGKRNVPEICWFHRGGTIYRNSGPERR